MCFSNLWSSSRELQCSIFMLRDVQDTIDYNRSELQASFILTTGKLLPELATFASPDFFASLSFSLVARFSERKCWRCREYHGNFSLCVAKLGIQILIFNGILLKEGSLTGI